MRILVILGHPRSESLCGALARAYAAGARSAGAQVRCINLGDLRFEKDVIHPSPRQQALEPDLTVCKEALEWANHVLFVFPTWWATMPALLKGFFDRIVLPGFAFRVDENSVSGYAPLLGGRSAHFITTMDSPRWAYRWIYGRPGHRAMKKGILGFCGMRPVTSTWVCAVKHLTERQRAEAIESARALGRNPPEQWARLRTRRRLAAWLRVGRLHFYGMTILAYGLGAVASTRLESAAFSWSLFIVGFLCLFPLELGSVLLNEIHDQGTDRRNENGGPFTGGSRVLVDGRLSEKQVHCAARIALATSLLALLALLALHVLGGRSGNWSLGVIAWMAVGFVLGPGYTAPPLRLSGIGLRRWLTCLRKLCKTDAPPEMPKPGTKSCLQNPRNSKRLRVRPSPPNAVSSRNPP